MRLEKLDNKILVWTTGRKNNSIDYDSTNTLDKYSRWNLSYIEDFLRENKEIEEADRIKSFMGKRMKIKELPRLIPVGNYRINVGLKSLKRQLENFLEDFNLNLNPEFQRAHVWSLNQRIAFVEFILQEGKANPIYFNYPNWMRKFEVGGELVIVDGKQRLTSLLMFLDNEFPVFKSLDKEGVGFYADEFDLVSGDLVFIINDLPTKKQVLEWYLQMNKGNVAHTEDELKKVEELILKEE